MGDRITFSTLVLKPSFSQSLSIHSHLSFAQADILDLTTRCLGVTGDGSVGEYSRSTQPICLLDAQ